MKVVIADTGALISLIHIGQLDLIEEVFGNFYIAKAVWDELQKYDNPDFDVSILKDIESKVKVIKTKIICRLLWIMVNQNRQFCMKN